MTKFRESQTAKNLLTSFAGESQARNRYTYFARRAREEGFIQIADIFDETALQECEHALRFFKFFNGGEQEITWSFPSGVIQSTHANLIAAADASDELIHELTRTIYENREQVVAKHPAGRAINPQALRGQIEGGLVMGIGTALTEAYRVVDGVPQTRRWADYGVPTMRHMPQMDLHIVEHPTADGPYGAKGIGELPAIPTAPAICNAIYNAVGVRAFELPIKPEELGIGGSAIGRVAC